MSPQDIICAIHKALQWTFPTTYLFLVLITVILLAHFPNSPAQIPKAVPKLSAASPATQEVELSNA